ncbi:MAG: response regulator transcription factor [Chloroflexi bacterium]|nr:response regulator transcription factor [Chloroflexota bacterium]
MKSIMVAHPVPAERERLSHALEGFEVIPAADNGAALRDLYQRRPSLVVVAEQLLHGPDPRLRVGQLPRLPLIVVGDGKELARAMALESGADMYLAEPVRPRELAARVTALLRRYDSMRSALLHLDPATKRIVLEGRSAQLTATEFRLLSCLTYNEGRMVPFARLLSDVWEGRTELDTLHYYARRLRQKLQLISLGEHRLSNCRGEGYCYCGPRQSICETARV